LAKRYGKIRASLAEKVPLSCQSNSESRKTQSTGIAYLPRVEKVEADDAAVAKENRNQKKFYA